MEKLKPYTGLKIVSVILKIIGALDLVLLPLLGIVTGAVEDSDAGIVLVVAGIVSGLLMIAFGEILELLIDLARSSRQTANELETLRLRRK